MDLIPQDIPLDVAYEDGDVIVVNKPPSRGWPMWAMCTRIWWVRPVSSKNSLSGINGELRPGIVHRIDRDTSGLIIAAKNDRAHLALALRALPYSRPYRFSAA